jgi:hypothetical protein
MHRTFRRNLSQPPPLSFRKISNHDKFFLNPIDQFGPVVARITILSLHRCISKSDLNIFKRPTLSVSIHPHGYAGACTQRCQQEFERVRSGIAATHIAWLVGVEQMVAHRYGLNVPDFAAFHEYSSCH